MGFEGGEEGVVGEGPAGVCAGSNLLEGGRGLGDLEGASPIDAGGEIFPPRHVEQAHGVAAGEMGGGAGPFVLPGLVGDLCACRILFDISHGAPEMVSAKGA